MNLWHITEETFDPTPKPLHSQETVYTIGNGYFCTRGTFEEDYPKANPATLLYGVFDKVPIAKEELANAPDWLPIKLFVNGERFRLDRGRVLTYQRTLDIQTGVLTRTVYWEATNDARITVTSERFASLADEHLGIIRYSVTADECPSGDTLDLVLWASLNTTVGNYDLLHWETLNQSHENDLVWLLSQTRHTNVQLAQTMSFHTEAQDFRKEVIDSDIAPSIRLSGSLTKGATFTAEKVVTFYTSRDGADAPLSMALTHHREIAGETRTTPEPDIHHALSIEQAEVAPSTIQPHVVYESLLTANKQAWQQFWEVADVIIEGDDKAQLGMRYNIYQLRINTSLHDSRYSIAAKGMTGFGYRGHVFHDTEIFMLPFFTYVQPDVARNLLLYRYHTLPAACQKAKHNGYEGAQYAWESTLSGEETTPSSIIHPETGEVIPVLNGSLELHITSSIAHAAHKYWTVTSDDAFMRNYGAEILLSTATFWGSRVEKNAEHNDYELTNVIGPDEWHEHVNNNAFTNYMVRWNIQAALDILHWLHEHAPEKAQQLTEQLDLNSQRLEHWQDVVAHMRVPYDPKTHLFEQFDDYFKLEILDQSKYKGRKDSYQGILGIEEIQKYTIIKQADVLMLLTVMKDDFDLETKKANWDFYYPLTDHDYGSSLTPAFHVILACELGLANEAYELFVKGALVDLENLRGNTPEGIHTACSGAVWQAAILGFAGLTQTHDGYSINPHLPDKWTRLAFTCLYKGEPKHFDIQR